MRTFTVTTRVFNIEDYALKKGDTIEILNMSETIAKDGSVWVLGPYFRSPCKTTMEEINIHCVEDK